MADERQLTINLALKSGTMKQQINSINKEIKSMESEFKNAGAGVENFEKTNEGLSAKLKLQQSVLDKLKDKLTVYKQEQEKCTQTLDKAINSYEKQQSKVKSLEQALESAKNTYGESSNEVKELKEELDKANKTLETKKNSVINANNSLTSMNTTINKTEAEVKSMTSEIEKTNEELDNIDNNNVDDLGDSFNKTEKDAVAFGAQMTIIGEGVRRVGESVVEAGKKMVGAMSELVSAGSEYSAEVAGTDFLLQKLDSTTQDLINTNAKKAESLGMTSKQYTQSALKLANYQKTMGFTTDEINNMNESTIQMVADLAAIEDVPFEEAMSSYQSMLKGNYEAGDRLNIAISANTLANTDYIKSLGKSWKDLSENEKMTAIYLETQRQATSATGLAAQEAAEFGMQNKLLSQRINELKGSIGEKLLPVLEPFLAKVNEIVGVISNWVNENPKLVTAITGIATAIGVILVVAGTLITTLGTTIIMWGAISTALAGASIPFLAIAGVIAGVIGVIVLLVGAIKSNFEGIKLAIENLKNKFSENFGVIRETFNNTWIMLQDIYNTIVKPLFDTIGILIEGIVNFIADCMPGISIAFKLVFDIVKSIWDSVGKPIAEFMMEIFGGVVDWFVANLPFLSQVFNDVMNLLANAWNIVGKPLFDFIKSYISYVITFLKPIISLLGTVFSVAFNVIKIAWNVLYPVFETIITIISKVVSVVATGMTKFQNAITSAMSAVLKPIQWVIDKISDLFSWLGSASSKIGGFIEKINPFKNLFRSVSMTVNPEISNLDTSGLSTFSLENIALSGSYYTPTSRASLDAGNMINQVNGDVTSSTLGIMKEFISELSSLKSAIEELRNNNDKETNVSVNVNLDGKDIKAQTTKEVIKTINRSTNNYKKGKGGLAFG